MASGMLDIQSLPSLERFDSQLLELFRQGGNDAGGAALHIVDDMQAPDDELTLHSLTFLKANQQKAAPGAAAALPHQQQDINASTTTDAAPATSSSEGHGTITPFAQPQSPRNPQQHADHPTPAAAAGAARGSAAEYAAAGWGYSTHAAPAVPFGVTSELLSMAATNPFAAALAGTHTLHHHPKSPFAAAAGATDIEAYARTLASMGGMADLAAGMGGSGSDTGVGFKRRTRGAAMPDLIKMEQDYMMECESPGPAKRGKGQRGDAYALSGLDSDDDDRTAGLSITADMDEATRARIRREKNRVAARKCRAKKMQFMVELQKTLRELMRKNEEYRLQVITWHKMFSREVRLREAMKRIIAVMWQSGVPPAASGYSATDVIIGLESGTLDVNGLVHTLAVLSAHHHMNAQDSITAAAAADAAAAATAPAAAPAAAAAAPAAAAAAAAPAAAGLGKDSIGGGFSLGAVHASPFAADSPTAAGATAVGIAAVGPTGGGMSVPDTPHGQPDSPAAALLQLQQSDGITYSGGIAADALPDSTVGETVGGTGAEVVGVPGSTTGGAVGDTGAELAAVPGSTAGGTVTSSTPLSGEFDNTVLPQSLLVAAHSSHVAAAALAAAAADHAPPAAAATASETTPAAAAVVVPGTDAAAVSARRNTSAHLEEVLAAAGFGDLQKFDSIVVPGLPDMRTQSSGLRALSSGIWVWGA